MRPRGAARRHRRASLHGTARVHRRRAAARRPHARGAAKLKRTPGFPPTLKRLGQHFLTDRAVLARIVDAVAPTATDRVVEIGPGRGALTELLHARAGSLVVIELDRALAELLRTRYAGDDRVEVVEADVLQVALDRFGEDVLLVGNVPYYITTPILFHTLEGALPRRSVFLVQREVAERLVAPPGGGDYGALTVNLQAVAAVELLFRVPPGAFSPPPRVDSAVIRVTPLPEPLVAREERPLFRTFVQALFSQRRKQLGTSLRAVLAASSGDAAAGARRVLDESGIPHTERPERLAPADFVRLFRAVGQRER